VAINAVCFVFGSVSLLSFPVLPQWWLFVLVTVIGIIAVRKAPPLTCFAAGFLLAGWQAAEVLQARFASDWLHREITVTGVVVGLPDTDSRKTRFLFSVEARCDNDALNCQRIHPTLTRLSWYRDAPVIEAGQQWQFKVKLREPHGFMNPGGFDYEKWLFQQRIVATGYVRDSDSAALLDRVFHPSHAIQGLRSRLKQRLDAALRGRDHRGLILAIAIGDRSAIDREQWQQYIATGTNHLLAISGLHISLVAAFAALLAAAVWRRVMSFQRVSRHAFVLAAGLLAALIYSALAGFAVPTQRALLMFAVVVVLNLTARHQNRHRSLVLALALVCAVDPLVVMSAGFWMSFAAVAILFVIYTFVQQVGKKQRLYALLRGHLLITIGLYPVGIFFFGHMSLVSPVANFVAVPVVGMLLTPVIFVASLIAIVSVQGAQILLLPVDWILSLLAAFLSFISTWEFALNYISFSGNPVLLWSAGLAALCVLPVPWRLRWVASVFALPIFISTVAMPGHGAYKVTFLDVGQGTSVVVQTQDHVLVYDTGAKFSETFNAADAVILPYLRTNGIKQIDTLMISHADNDHSGGAPALINGIEVDQVVTSAPIDGLASGLCRAGQRWRWDGVSFEVLHPQEHSAGSRNDRSCVLLITGADQSRTLLAGDIEASAELEVLERGLPEVDILLAPHHGSSTSSRRVFVEAVSPDYVVHTTGYRNRYGFPHPPVIQAYENVGAQQFNTALSGAVTFNVGGDDGITVSSYRLQQQALWHQRFPHDVLH